MFLPFLKKKVNYLIYSNKVKPKKRLSLVFLGLLILFSTAYFIWRRDRDINKTIYQTENNNLVQEHNIEKNVYSDWLIYNNNDYKFRIQYPKDWHTTTIQKNKIILSANKILLNTDAHPGLSVFLIVYENPLNLSLEDWRNQNKKQPTIINSTQQNININGESATQYIDVLKTPEQSLESGYISEDKYKNTSTYFIKNKKIYELSWNSIEVKDNQREIVDTIIKSFKFNN
ncbi:MAG: hypothetical protein UV36_C0008G0007 [Parcubacteria group bacterium GW2011_GWC2_42_6]|nr:MAG: hypothetical protein UV36_C0008G0007 [Parcubacteria group bacterium GW2011_GWC2_42_6]KKT76730.1 MAG: hypothetical protein UW72_C0002G0032 [Parcubacteria group bacterium GW2011_GWF2_44_7]